MTLEFTVRLLGAVRHDDECGVFVSFCPALKLYSQGTTETEARNALESAVKLFLVTCFERGQLTTALRSLGFAPTNKTISTDARVKEFIEIREANFPETFEVEVPIQLLAAQHQQLAASA